MGYCFTLVKVQIVLWTFANAFWLVAKNNKSTKQIDKITATELKNKFFNFISLPTFLLRFILS